ncbi:hypothetical protein [Anaerotardibacter muris]|uniref:HEAT repeat domain-containing protein n=1 Tax=Anaerotardibacter muris TaxID=2941505 RepID=UPI0030840796
MCVSEKSETIKETAQKAIESKETMDALIEDLSGSSRRARQNAAAVFAQIAKIDPEVLVPYHDDFIDALKRPEAQTRWESLEVLTTLVPSVSKSCEKALPDAETALFDEESGFVRLAAVRFLCKLGSTTELRSEKVWPLLDEAIQCYHGDYEYQDMLIALIGFSEGKISKDVKAGLKDRMAFDAEKSKGALKRRSQQIIDNLG